MDKNELFTPQEKKDNNRQIVIISLMVMAVLLIAELYVMINMAGNIVALAVVTILFVGSAYFFGKAILKEIHNSNTQAKEQYEALEKSGKASYILLKKTMEQLEELQGNTKTPADDIITAQKAIAKVTISRNKENTDALMNSNDKVIEKIFDFEENLGNNQSDLLDKQRQMMDDSMKELMIKQQEMTSTMKAMEESIKSELLQAMSSIQIAQPQPELAMENISLGEPELAMEDIGLGEPELSMEDIRLEEPELSMEDIGLEEPELSMEDIGLEEPELSMEDIGLEEPELSMEDIGLEEPELSMEDIGLEEPELSMEDIGLEEPELSMEDISLGEPELSMEDISLGDNGMTDTMDLGLSEDLGFSTDLDFAEPSISADIDLGIDLLSEEEPLVKESIVEESVVEEPELIEPEFAEPEFAEPEFAAEEDLGMPDLSDPHKLMTPEEIAALIAKM